MKTANDMTLELQEVFDRLKTGELNHKIASEMNNSVGKMIGLAKVQLEHCKLRNEEPNIPFLKSADDTE